MTGGLAPLLGDGRFGTGWQKALEPVREEILEREESGSKVNLKIRVSWIIITR